MTFAGAVSGSGALRQDGSGTLILTGASTYSGGTTIAAGTLQIGDGGTTGAIGGKIVNDGALVFNRSDDIAFGGIISGSGGLTKAGAGVLTLSGANTYSGDTTIAGGTVRVEHDTAFGTGSVITTGSVIDYANGVDIGNAIIIDSDHTRLQVQTGSATQSGAVTETGGSPRPLEKTGAGTLIVISLGNSGATTVSAGTLKAGATGAFGVRSAYTVAAGATLDLGGFRQTVDSLAGGGTVTNSGASAATLQLGIAGVTTASTTFAGVIKDGAGRLSLEVHTSGTFTLTGANTYTGTTLICDCATLQIGNGGTTGSITSDVINNGVLAFNRSDSYRFDNLIVNGLGSPGRVEQNGSGTTIFTANQAYTGGTTINAGTLQIGNGGTTGSVVGDITVRAGAGFAIARADTYVLTNLVSGAGRLIQRGSGTTILGGGMSYTGGTVIEAGTLKVGQGETSGSLGSGAIVNNGALIVDRRGTFTIADSMTGSGSFTMTGGNDGTGVTVVTGAFGHGGGTTISGGTLRIGNGGTTGSISGAVFNSGILVFDRSDNWVADAAISGSGAVVQAGGGTTILTGAANYAGGTTIAGGTLQIGNGGTSGSISGNIVNAGTLVFNRSDGLTYDGVISGAGTIRQAGGGRTNLTGNSAGFTGTTSIEAGTLAVNGTLGGTITIGAGGALGGNGTVGSTTIAGGGALAPGNSIGTLTIAGNLTFAAGSRYLVEVSPVAADRTNVTGTATLAGTVNASFAPGTYVARQYTILNAAGGRSGTFASLVETDLPQGFKASLSYDATTAYLNLDLAIPTYTGLNRNQRNVVDGIAASFYAAGGIPMVFGSLTPGGLTIVSGEIATGTQQTVYNTASLFLNLMLDPMAGARGATAAGPASSLIEMADLGSGSTPAARVEAGWSVWTKAFGQANRTASDAGLGAAGTASSIFGVAAGADRRISADALLGFALAGGGTSFGGRGTGTGDFFQAGLYGSTRLGGGYLSAALAYGWNRFDVTRTVGIGAINETYTSSPVAQSFGGRIEAGQRFGARWLALTPYVALEAIGYSASGYSEGFAAPATGQFALSYGARSTGTLRTELGLRFDSLVALAPGSDLITYGRLAYGYQAGVQRSIGAAFQTLVNSGFVVFGARASTNTALASLGAEARLDGGMRVTATLDGELGDRHRSIRANLGLRHEW